ncbi:MAG: hypothetical protein VKK04_09010 [Synechococcales bacterium]|nr:hypothetical protein [Synechococcales bacterium]
MKLNLVDRTFRIELDWQERLLAFYLSPTLEIDIAQIQDVSTQKPPQDWLAIRAPGTALPGVITAGTYYTRRGREFWYVTRNSNFLVLILTPDAYFKRVMLTRDDHEVWARAIAERQTTLGLPPES